MKTYTFEGKTKEAAVELALEELKISEEDLIINNITEKSGLLKILLTILKIYLDH